MCDMVCDHGLPAFDFCRLCGLAFLAFIYNTHFKFENPFHDDRDLVISPSMSPIVAACSYQQVGNAIEPDRNTISKRAFEARGEKYSVPNRAIIYFALSTFPCGRSEHEQCLGTTICAQHQIQHLAFCTNSCYMIRLHISIFGLCWYLQGCGNVAVRRSVSLSGARANNRRWMFEFYNFHHSNY